MTARASILLSGLLVVGLSAGWSAGRIHAAAHPAAAILNTPQSATVTVGFGAQGSNANVMAPKYLYVTVGDTVTWRDNDALEPHTVSFGPTALLKKLGDQNIMPLPQKGGPPLMAIAPQVVQA